MGVCSLARAAHLPVRTYVVHCQLELLLCRWREYPRFAISAQSVGLQ
jgi:hypothetical protein